MKTILAPVDFSAATDAVVKEAADLARSVHGRVILLHVVQPPRVVAEYAPHLEDIAEITATAERKAAAKLAAMAEELSSIFMEAESVHLVGAVIPQIVGQAEKCAADYIVMGSHGHSAFYDLFVGSTTHGVIQKARCPVIIIPARELARRAERKAKRQAVAA